jgi:cell division protein ZapA
MSQVTVNIDGKAYRMACEEGQEEHLTTLATRFDRYVSHLKHQFGEIGDLRLTVMSAIMVMDELRARNPAQDPRRGTRPVGNRRPPAGARLERSDRSCREAFGAPDGPLRQDIYVSSRW